MHTCEGNPDLAHECTGVVRQYVVHEMMGSIEMSTFSASWCPTCHVEAQILYGPSPAEAWSPSWHWEIEPAGLVRQEA